jgi:hypothetical protein
MRRVGAFLCFCSFAFVVSAQHGKSEKGGLYTFPYNGDTWTGEIVAVDPSTRDISLQFTDKKGQTEKFTARLLPGLAPYVKDYKEQKVSSLNLGDKVVVYYIAIGQKYPVTDEHGKKKEIPATENMVFEAEVFPAKKDKK